MSWNNLSITNKAFKAINCLTVRNTEDLIMKQLLGTATALKAAKPEREIAGNKERKRVL